MLMDQETFLAVKVRTGFKERRSNELLELVVVEVNASLLTEFLLACPEMSVPYTGI